jgi:hypothetical protein
MGEFKARIPPCWQVKGSEEIYEPRSVNGWFTFSRVSNPYLDCRISRPLVGWMGRAFFG